nr:hypothetical protein [Polyangiaceae bacterium]
DLSVVAGTITKVFQDVTSHVNLKAKERGTPNMVLRDFDKQATLLALKDKPVHLVVKKDQYVIEPTTQAIVDAKIKEQLSKPWIPLKIVNETRVLPYESMCGPTSSAPLCLESRYAFGGKAAGMAFLTHKGVVGRTVDKGSQSERLGYNIVPPGFGVPISSYQAFVNGNPVLAAKLKTLIAKEKTGALSPNERIKLAEEVQALFYKGKIPAAQWTAITTELAKFQAANPNVKKIKVRSSSNAEDIPKFDGAGLHDSFAAEFDEVDLPDLSCAIEEKIENGVVTKLKVDPKTVQCAVKAVYGSLWNARAIDERTFGRVDHETASMGLAIVPAYDTDADIASNGVVITRPVNGDGVVGYTLSLQKGENLVTNPEPGTISQMTLAVFGDLNRAPRFTTVRNATPILGGPPLTTSVLAEKDLLTITEIVKKTEIAYCKAKPSYFPGQNCNYVWIDSDKPAALDMEFKFLENGHFVLKQLREFHGE